MIYLLDFEVVRIFFIRKLILLRIKKKMHITSKSNRLIIKNNEKLILKIHIFANFGAL